LGFVIGAAGYLAKAASNNTLSQADIGFVTIDVLEGLFGKPGVEAAQQQMQLLKQGKATDYQRGIANGQKTVLAGLGAVGEMMEDPDVKAALTEGDQNSVPATLQKRLFYDYVAKKYGER